MYPIKQSDWNRYRGTVLDHGLNVAILQIAQRLLPQGFDVSDKAPDSYEALVACFESGGRYVVFSDGSENTIYGDPEVNHHFRAWHDWCHWQGKYDFSLEGELGAYRMQCSHLEALYGDTKITAKWRRILYAEVVGQKLYCRKHGYFPDDQLAFIKRFLDDPGWLEKGPGVVADGAL
jgi:hypothetical protein